MHYDATLTSKGQVTIPAALRTGLALEPGDQLTFSPGKDGEIIIKKKKTLNFEEFLAALPKPPDSTIRLSVEEMNDAIAQAVVEDHERIRRDYK